MKKQSLCDKINIRLAGKELTPFGKWCRMFAGGMIFNRFDEKNGNIYISWLVHMFANFATNTIGFILFAV